MNISSCLMLISFPWVAHRLDGNMPSGVPLRRPPTMLASTCWRTKRHAKLQSLLPQQVLSTIPSLTAQQTLCHAKRMYK
ncbi:hypothetical protein MUK42_33822 [Musa troglodytarum]|uniref:Secreted protein n=1 Tax=Musa troglodytarum TaxID=320322 RepID=A0A9E7ED56_9LILI|nr:hypothetical protein MUK42_33822 [Musa troglodytarum]